MVQVRHTAGCLCGAVRLEMSGEPSRVGICHCLDCRKHHGAVFATFAVFPADAVAVMGETQDLSRPPFLSRLRILGVQPLRG